MCESRAGGAALTWMGGMSGREGRFSGLVTDGMSSMADTDGLVGPRLALAMVAVVGLVGLMVVLCTDTTGKGPAWPGLECWGDTDTGLGHGDTAAASATLPQGQTSTQPGHNSHPASTAPASTEGRATLTLLHLERKKSFMWLHFKQFFHQIISFFLKQLLPPKIALEFTCLNFFYPKK